MDGKLEIGRCQPQGEPGVVTDRKGLIERQGEGLKEASVGGSWNSCVARYEGDGACVLHKGPEGDRKVGVCLRRTQGARSGQQIRIRALSGWWA